MTRTSGHKLDKEVLLHLLKRTIKKETEVLASLISLVNESYLQAVHAIAECPGHVLVSGIGTSSATARRLAHLLCCSGVPAVFLDAGDSLHGSSGAIRQGDVVIVVSKGGETDEINKLVEIAKERGARTIAITESLDSTLGKMCHIAVVVAVPTDADPFGMIATTSSLANALVGDALCAAAMSIKGYTPKEFAKTHPGGAVGKKIRKKETESESSIS